MSDRVRWIIAYDDRGRERQRVEWPELRSVDGVIAWWLPRIEESFVLSFMIAITEGGAIRWLPAGQVYLSPDDRGTWAYPGLVIGLVISDA